jgi:hypothetical protein
MKIFSQDSIPFTRSNGKFWFLMAGFKKIILGAGLVE